MPTGSHNGKSEQFVIRVPIDVAEHIRARASGNQQSAAKTVVNALRLLWDVPEPPKASKPTDKAA